MRKQAILPTPHVIDKERRNGQGRKGWAKGLTIRGSEDMAVRSNTNTHTLSSPVIDNNDSHGGKVNTGIDMCTYPLMGMLHPTDPLYPPFSTHTLPNHQVGFTTEVRMRRALLITRLKL
ncbi:hypothetical protein CEXT_439311 [Caerostris extrusa]|uniref:Uncharacterized protein n=1 Tax=Caerostris extrusa TaxID=172846 RepID=A0AAV4TY99_CAEEX|nr:hypothetical protein CEXT_439311 [Caerostris extrusa]